MNISEFISQLRWRPQIGDPSFMGWLTVTAYGLTAILCLIVALRHPVVPNAKEANLRRHMWLGVVVLMAFLCINKQLDLQSLFTDVGRVIANRTGWYDQRRIVQRWFVLAIAATGTGIFAFTAWRLRSVLRERWLLILGLISLLTFIVIRAAFFHHVDEFLGWRLLGLRMNWILELGGIGLIALSAVQAARRRHQPAASNDPS